MIEKENLPWFCPGGAWHHALEDKWSSACPSPCQSQIANKCSDCQSIGKAENHGFQGSQARHSQMCRSHLSNTIFKSLWLTNLHQLQRSHVQIALAWPEINISPKWFHKGQGARQRTTYKPSCLPTGSSYWTPTQKPAARVSAVPTNLTTPRLPPGSTSQRAPTCHHNFFSKHAISWPVQKQVHQAMSHDTTTTIMNPLVWKEASHIIWAKWHRSISSQIHQITSALWIEAHLTGKYKGTWDHNHTKPTTVRSHYL
jgi:hypothetical protein